MSTTEYRGRDSGIDGVLWRQIAGFEDPLPERFYTAQSTEPSKYLDLSSTDTTAKFSVFISSGPRSGGPTDDGRTYSGPSGVFTCYAIEAQFRGTRESLIERRAFDD